MAVEQLAKRLERYFKGAANHRRIQMLFLIGDQPGLTVDLIRLKLKLNFKTTSEHLRRLVSAGLVDKRYDGRWVKHRLSPYGQRFLRFMKTFV